MGDKFITKTFGQYFQQNETRPFYLKDNYDSLPFSKNEEYMTDPIVTSRVRNALVAALNKKAILPKYIVIVLEADFITGMNYKGAGITLLYGKNLEKLANEINRLILARKDQLPKKSKKDGYPQILWVEPPTHVNFFDNTCRMKFNDCLEAILPRFQNMAYLKLKDRWDFRRNELFRNGKYTALGLAAYWEAIDAGMAYWDSRRHKPKFVKRLNFEDVKKPCQDGDGMATKEDKQQTYEKDLRFKLPPFAGRRQFQK